MKRATRSRNPSRDPRKKLPARRRDPGDTLDLTAEDKPRAKGSLRMGIDALAEFQDRLYAQDVGRCC